MGLLDGFLIGIGYKTKTVAQLWKRGWNEIPEVMASGILAVMGLGMIFYKINEYNTHDGDYRIYRMTYVVYRPDDPDIAHIKYVDEPKKKD